MVLNGKIKLSIFRLLFHFCDQLQVLEPIYLGVFTNNTWQQNRSHIKFFETRIGYENKVVDKPMTEMNTLLYTIIMILLDDTHFMVKLTLIEISATS